jgi:membrane protein YqaA with SNARE-associated domain
MATAPPDRRAVYLSSMSPPPAAPADRRARAPLARLRRRGVALVSALHRWAESGWAHPAAGSWGLLQGSVVPGPSEALLIPLGLADARRAYSLALWTLAGSVLGGMVAYGIGAIAFQGNAATGIGIAGMDAARMDRMRELIAARGWVVVLLAAGVPVIGSAKVVSFAAGAFGIPFLPFSLALLAARGIRYLVVALLIHLAGERVESWAIRVTGRPLPTAGRAPAPSP